MSDTDQDLIDKIVAILTERRKSISHREWRVFCELVMAGFADGKLGDEQRAFVSKILEREKV
jgi:hypothetical protein